VLIPPITVGHEDDTVDNSFVGEQNFNIRFGKLCQLKVNYPAAELRGIKNQNPTVLGADT
jgi:hypothetical protein